MQTDRLTPWKRFLPCVPKQHFRAYWTRIKYVSHGRVGHWHCPRCSKHAFINTQMIRKDNPNKIQNYFDKLKDEGRKYIMQLFSCRIIQINEYENLVDWSTLNSILNCQPRGIETCQITSFPGEKISQKSKMTTVSTPAAKTLATSKKLKS